MGTSDLQLHTINHINDNLTKKLKSIATSLENAKTQKRVSNKTNINHLFH